VGQLICDFNPEISTCGHLFCLVCQEAFQQYGCNQNAACRAMRANKDSWLLTLAVLQQLNNGAGFRSTHGTPSKRTSPKFEAAVQVLMHIPSWVNEKGIVCREKAVIFSQWTGCLDLFESFLQMLGLLWQRIDGTMDGDQRIAALCAYETDPSCSVLLLSLHAASTGVNIQFGNHVLLLDPWWNPIVEDQAVDRCHRIGQEKTVHVYKFVLEGSIKDQVVGLQDNKRDMVKKVIYSKGKGNADNANADLNFIMHGMMKQLNKRAPTQRPRDFGDLNANWKGYLDPNDSSDDTD